MADRSYKAFVVEGEAREPLIIKNISDVFFKHANFEIITLPAGQNIYMLWKKLKEDEFFTDIIEVLRESSEDIERQLSGLCRDDFAEVYLFFDYDGHHNNLSDDDGSDDILEQMLISFDNETENGKLYINYPMVESLRDFKCGKCGAGTNCFIKISEFSDYKKLSAEHSEYPQFRDYTFQIWEEIIDIFGMRVSCLMNRKNVIDYDSYIKEITPYEIYCMEKCEIERCRVFTLSAFPEFLLDYHGVRLWNSCVKHTRNKLYEVDCSKRLHVN